MRPAPVTTLPVVRGAVFRRSTERTVEAAERVSVKSRVSGTVLELRVREGARRKGRSPARSISALGIVERSTSDAPGGRARGAAASPRLAAGEAQLRSLEAGSPARTDRGSDCAVAADACPAGLDRAKRRAESVEARLGPSRRYPLDPHRGHGSSTRRRAVVSEFAARLSDADVRLRRSRSPADGRAGRVRGGQYPSSRW